MRRASGDDKHYMGSCHVHRPVTRVHLSCQQLSDEDSKVAFLILDTLIMIRLHGYITDMEERPNLLQFIDRAMSSSASVG